MIIVVFDEGLPLILCFFGTDMLLLLGPHTVWKMLNLKYKLQS